MPTKIHFQGGASVDVSDEVAETMDALGQPEQFVPFVISKAGHVKTIYVRPDHVTFVESI